MMMKNCNVKSKQIDVLVLAEYQGLNCPLLESVAGNSSSFAFKDTVHARKMFFLPLKMVIYNMK